MAAREACSCLRGLKPRSRNVTYNPPTTAHIPAGRRQLTTEAAGATASTTATVPDTTLDPFLSAKGARKPRAKKDQYYKTSAGILLCRSPIVTREQSEFEQAFYAYQRHLKSRLSSPFPTDFYFTKGSLASKRWQGGEESRQRANELASISSANNDNNNTAATAQQTTGELTGQERELQDEEDVASAVAVSRRTEADAQGDTKSLNRRLDRTLYLLLKKPRSEHSWQFPQGPVGANEALHDSSARILATLAGRDMNTWCVGRVPVGHLTYSLEEPSMGFEGNKIYFMKSRIFAGQCRLQRDVGVEDFGWFTREEVQEKVAPEYWKSISSMLASQ